MLKNEIIMKRDIKNIGFRLIVGNMVWLNVV